MRLKIGEFARLGQVSVQTIRFYDDIGLLKPSQVDPFTNYRYYTLEQLPCLMRILALKDLGIPLEQIGRLVAENISLPELRRALLIRREELNQQVQNQLEQLERIEARLKLMEQDEIPFPYEVIIKNIAPLKVATRRGIVATYWDVSPLWESLFKTLGQHNLTPCAPNLTLCYASEPEIDLEVCAPLSEDVKEAEELDIRTLPAIETMACTIHQGPFGGLAGAFSALMKWIDSNGYVICGPDREIYLRLPEECQFKSDANAITELQIPVQKK